MTIDKPNTLYFPKTKEWVLQDDYFDSVLKILIPAGFRYDGASVPRLFWAIINPLDLSEAAPLVHDYLYRNAGLDVPVYVLAPDGKTVIPCNAMQFSKEFADSMFRDIMIRWDVTPWKESAAYHAVDKFAGFAWREHLRKNVA